MKTIFCTLSILFILATTAFASNKIFNAEKELPQTALMCGETDTITLLMDDSPIYLNTVIVTMKGVGELAVYGYFWKTPVYSFPINGDIAIEVNQQNILAIIIIYFLLCLILFLVYYFSHKYSNRRRDAGMGLLITGVSPTLLGFVLGAHALHGGWYAWALLLFFLTAWLVAWLIKKSADGMKKWKFNRSLDKLSSRVAKDLTS